VTDELREMRAAIARTVMTRLGVVTLTPEQELHVALALELELSALAVRAARAEDWSTLRALEKLRLVPGLESPLEPEPLTWDELSRFAMPEGAVRQPYRERACPHCLSGRLGEARVVYVDEAGVERWGHPYMMNRPDAADLTPEQIERGTLIQGAYFCSPPSGPHPMWYLAARRDQIRRVEEIRSERLC
jgi:hypothetical protein